MDVQTTGCRQEVNMNHDIALWKSENGLTEDERTIVMRYFVSSLLQTHWLQTTWFWQFIVTLPTLNAASTFCVKPLKKRFTLMLTSTVSNL